jgi:hypothetical protein
LHQRLIETGGPRSLLLKGCVAPGQGGTGFGERPFGGGSVELEFLIQGLECLGLGLRAAPFGHQHWDRGVVVGMLAAVTSLIRGRQTPELGH